MPFEGLLRCAPRCRARAHFLRRGGLLVADGSLAVISLPTSGESRAWSAITRVVSALATFALARGRDRAPGTAGGWALVSAIAAVLLFAVLFVTLVIVACAIDADSCS
jgi:hypothetical protein